ncbi:hypothetical protein AYI69_g1656 [Smittium culicis]|uniref:Uncharacterized protein n=1 Tax=Smittium culicis TaxID=133412 RepID=A0A1R1YPL6_9FUNG|nr:hypothetical protein AYI69_g1656 [Smittium culicis]
MLISNVCLQRISKIKVGYCRFIGHSHYKRQFVDTPPSPPPQSSLYCIAIIASQTPLRRIICVYHLAKSLEIRKRLNHPIRCMIRANHSLHIHPPHIRREWRFRAHRPFCAQNSHLPTAQLV